MLKIMKNRKENNHRKMQRKQDLIHKEKALMEILGGYQDLKLRGVKFERSRLKSSLKWYSGKYKVGEDN